MPTWNRPFSEWSVIQPHYWSIRYTFSDDGEHKPWTENHGKIIVSLSSFFLRLNLTVDASTEPQLSLYTPYTILCAQAALCEGVIVIILWGWLIARTTQAKPQMWHGHSS